MKDTAPRSDNMIPVLATYHNPEATEFGDACADALPWSISSSSRLPS